MPPRPRPRRKTALISVSIEPALKKALEEKSGAKLSILAYELLRRFAIDNGFITQAELAVVKPPRRRKPKAAATTTTPELAPATVA